MQVTDHFISEYSLTEKAASGGLGKKRPSAKWLSTFNKLPDNSTGGFTRSIDHNEDKSCQESGPCGPDGLKACIESRVPPQKTHISSHGVKSRPANICLQPPPNEPSRLLPYEEPESKPLKRPINASDSPVLISVRH